MCFQHFMYTNTVLAVRSKDNTESLVEPPAAPGGPQLNLKVCNKYYPPFMLWSLHYSMSTVTTKHGNEHSVKVMGLQNSSLG